MPPLPVRTWVPLVSAIYMLAYTNIKDVYPVYGAAKAHMDLLKCSSGEGAAASFFLGWGFWSRGLSLAIVIDVLASNCRWNAEAKGLDEERKLKLG